MREEGRWLCREDARGHRRETISADAAPTAWQAVGLYELDVFGEQ